MELQKGTKAYGFTVREACDLPEIDGHAYIMRHELSGAKLLYLANDDANKAFSIAFKTPPVDDTGVFHILEHSVLCGSRKFPVKEPFVNLLKSSMQTFLNAMTFPDKTMYPVASTNEQDLLNLMDVYMDAVLHPNIYEKPEIFLQEGWHYEVQDADEEVLATGGAAGEGIGGEATCGAEGVAADATDGATSYAAADVVEGAGSQGKRSLSYNGVVFNEMKGALADPDGVAYNRLCEALFPDTAYRFESGGTPEAIPSLTYEQFLDSHSRHYRLDNSLILLYGDMDVARFLEFLDTQYLTPDAGLHKDAAAPNTLELQAPVVSEGRSFDMVTAPENSVCALGYVIGKSTEDVRITAADILLDALMGSNEAPLKRMLLDADLADDVSSFLADGMLQPFVLLQLRGLKEGAADRFGQVVRVSVEKILADGLDHEIIEAALSHAEFVMRERNFGIADGVAFAMSSAAGWLYDDEGALTYLRYEDNFAYLRNMLAGDYFERLMRELFLENDHRASVRIVPVPQQGPSTEAARLAAVAEDFTADDFDEVQQRVDALREAQERPDSPEDLAKLPHLGVADIDPVADQPAFWLDEEGTVPVIRHDVSSHGIVYVYRYYGLECVSFDEMPYVSVLANVLGKLDTADHTAAQIDTLCQANLGTMSCFTEVHATMDENELFPKLVLGASALPVHVDSLVELPEEISLRTKFLADDGAADADAVSKVKDLLVQRKVGLEQSFANNGHSAAMARVSSYYSRAAVLRGATSGVNMYRFLKDLLDGFDQKADALMDKLQGLSRRIFRPENCVMSFTGPEECLAEYRRLAAKGLDRVSSAGSGDSAFAAAGSDNAAFAAANIGDSASAAVNAEVFEKRLQVPDPAPGKEAFIVPTDVTFSAVGFDRKLLESEYSGAWLAASRVLSYDYLWNEVRVKGGAYGTGFQATLGGNSRFYSYRDPHLDRTIERFAQAGAWLKDFDLDREELEGYIVSSVSSMDAPLKPRAAGRRQDGWFFAGYDPSERAKIRTQLMEVTTEELQELGDVVSRIANEGYRCVFGAREAIEASELEWDVTDLLNE